VAFAFPGKAGQDPCWNPQVDKGQEIKGPKPAIYTPYDIPFTDQLVALKYPEKMNAIKDWIEEHYGKGAKTEDGKPVSREIHNLSPADAMELSREILRDWTRYDKGVLLQKDAKRVPNIDTILTAERSLSFDRLRQLVMENRPDRDKSEVLDLLKKKDDIDVTCENQAEAISVIFEAIKMLQEKGESKLNTTTVRAFNSTISTDPLLGHVIGKLDDKTKVFENSKKEIIGRRVDREAKPQEKYGEHDFGEGEIWILSPEQQKKVIPINDERLFLKDISMGHVLVQFITLDNGQKDPNKKPTYQAKVVDVSDVTEDGLLSTYFIQEALQAWHQDASSKELRKAHEELFAKAQDHSDLWYDHRQNRPLTLLFEVMEDKRDLNAKEKQWCVETLNEVEGDLKDPKFRMLPRAADVELSLNICKLCTETENFDLAERALKLCKEKDENGKRIEGGLDFLIRNGKLSADYWQRVELAEKVLKQRAALPVAPEVPAVDSPKPTAPKTSDPAKAGEATVRNIIDPEIKLPANVFAEPHEGEVQVPPLKIPNKLSAAGKPSTFKK